MPPMTGRWTTRAKKGKDADIVILDKDVNVRCVFSHGNIVEGTNTMIH